MQNNLKTTGKAVVLLVAYWLPGGSCWLPGGSCWVLQEKRKRQGRQKRGKQAAAIGANPAATKRPLHLPINRAAIAAVTDTHPHPFNHLAGHGANAGANGLFWWEFKRKVGMRGEIR